ncbi:protein of unknown function DUF349 [Thiorhodococcus drewsii AZ1]|uniref:DUF349 domain-containing protein n=1 Tax=Thiorhodococcus drewsii AZ1 TaxID=765913 RepID=G2E5B5_9GAMM|nr:DUF349 domain-containing protein [Thiorhodococcus drewsii]EGV28827.1 protein of unknown function DUF349 [Thiorhodococcus drewsii AZ1]
MLFQRFLKKRKQAAEATQQAVASQNQQTLTEQALSHADPGTRSKAIRQVVSPSVLTRILAQDADSGVRSDALERLMQILCEKTQPLPPRDELLAAFADIQDDELIERIAQHGVAPELRRSAIERTGSQPVLAHCAVHDALAANRARAIERLEDRAGLEQVVHDIGKRDKNVLRTAREKLRLIAVREEHPKRIRAQCEDICSKIERLGRLGNWTQDRALLDHLERQWGTIQDEAEPEWHARFQAECERFLTAYEEYRRENAAQIATQEAQEAARAEREGLIQELADAAALTEESELQAAGERIAASWDALPAAPDTTQRDLDARYRTGFQALEARRKALSDRRLANERLAKLTHSIERLLGESKPLDHKQVKTLLEQGRTLAAEASENALTEAFTAQSERLDARFKHQRKSAEQRLRQFPERLEELEAHLDSGELKKADPIHQSLQAALELIHMSGLQPATATELGQRLRVLAPKLRELQNWRRWGADQHREGLCAEMESLIDKDLPLAAVAEQLRSLQADWKGLDKTGSPANKALWERFQAASEQVYTRCRPFMEAQAAEREANAVARERVCAQLEDFLSKVDWERVDWKKILRAERETRQAWAAIGPTDPRQRKKLERRFHQRLKTLDQRLERERRQNQAHKQNLVEQVRALIEHPDLDTAIEQTKALQREWHTTVPARQKDENKLWQEFRAVCDAVFERRAAIQQAHANEMRDHLSARDALCDEALAFAETESDPQRLSTALRDFESRWRELESRPIPRQSASQSNQRWRDVRAAFESRRRAAEDRHRQAALELLQRQSELCERLESSLLDNDPEGTDPASAQQAWQQLPKQTDADLQQALETRFEFAQAAATDPKQREKLRKRREANDQRLSQLCLQLEIIAGVESPPEQAQQRLEYQVARLSERMMEGEEDPLEGTTRLLQDWYLCGPAADNTTLSQRFERVRLKLWSSQEQG